MNQSSSNALTMPGVTDEKHRTLLPVINAIPTHCYERPTWKGLVYILRSVVVYVATLTALALVHQWWLVLPLLVLASTCVASLFILGHDAAHGALFNSKRLNSIVGHLLFLPSLHAYASWVLGHNRIHHGQTVRQTMDFVWHPITPAQYRQMNRLQRARHRIEWSMFGVGLYYLREVWWNKMIRFTPPQRYQKAIRRDTLIIVAFAFAVTVVTISTMGFLAWLKLWVIPWLGFNCWIGFTVYVHHVEPGIKWWQRREWDSFHGQLEGTTILWAPWWLNFFMHNIFVHVPHHVDMRVPFYHLPDAARAIAAKFPEVIKERKFSFLTYVKNTRVCKLYDFDTHVWVGYDSASATALTSR